MATFVLIHGAASDSWYWHRVDPELRTRGHDVVLMDLPCDDDSAGLQEYADTVVDAIGDRTDLVLVAQSFAGFTAPLVCERVQVELLVMLNAMIPAPGESPGDWWANTGQAEAAREQAERDGRPVDEDDPMELYFHDVPEEVKAEAMKAKQKDQSGTPLEKPWPLEVWPTVPTRVLLSREDRLFPPHLQRRLARERLGTIPDEMDGGHLVALSRPEELADRLDVYWTDR